MEGLNTQICIGLTVVEASSWSSIDAKVRRHGEQKGLDTPVVRAVNAEISTLETWNMTLKANKLL